MDTHNNRITTLEVGDMLRLYGPPGFLGTWTVVSGRGRKWSLKSKGRYATLSVRKDEQQETVVLKSDNTELTVYSVDP